MFDSVYIKGNQKYRKSHCEYKTILPPSYLNYGISYIGKTIHLNWIAQV